MGALDATAHPTSTGDGHPAEWRSPPPRAPGLLLGIGLGGFVDGIVLHQILQWRHLLTDLGFLAFAGVLLAVGTVLVRTSTPAPS